MKSTAIFGRFSGGYLLLATVLLASALGVGQALAVLLTHAKPAKRSARPGTERSSKHLILRRP